MSEKRFELDVRLDMPKLLIDNATNKRYHLLLVNDIEEIVDLLNEQQATIRRLQDLCGKSDYENAKLRIENKKLQDEIKLLKPTNVEQYEQIVQLQEENEKLRKELGDCEKFRYTVFKRLNDEHIKERSIK